MEDALPGVSHGNKWEFTSRGDMKVAVTLEVTQIESIHQDWVMCKNYM